jgi:hypothetical protein
MPERYRSPSGTHPPDPRLEVRLDEDDGTAPRSRPSLRGMIGVAAAVVCVAVVAVPLSLALLSARSAGPPRAGIGSGPALHRVLSALNATIDSGSFDMTFSDQPPTTPSSPSTTTCPTSYLQKSVCGFAAPPGLTISGRGTIDTNPFAMVALSDVPGLGPITARANGTDVWEMGGGNYGLSPGSSSTGPGSPLSGFASSVEGTLGPRQGALAMMGLASPTGYLEMDQNAISSANQIGAGVVDGVAVTVYQVTLGPEQQANVPAATPEEATAIGDALAVLKQNGYTGTTVKVSIDAAGYIRRTTSVASFSDGATQTDEATFSHFGCAGRVLMPGQSGPASPPAACVSPDKPIPAQQGSGRAP